MISIPDYIKINLYAKSVKCGADVTMVNINYDRKEIEFKSDCGLSGGISFDSILHIFKVCKKFVI